VNHAHAERRGAAIAAPAASTAAPDRRADAASGPRQPKKPRHVTRSGPPLAFTPELTLRVKRDVGVGCSRAKLGSPSADIRQPLTWIVSGLPSAMRQQLADKIARGDPDPWRGVYFQEKSPTRGRHMVSKKTNCKNCRAR